MRNPTFLSLFSGCGGLDYGLMEAGFVPTLAFDHCKYSVDVYNSNFLSNAYTVDLSRGINLESLRPDVIVAGPPCQGFSTAGKRGFNDPRNLLLRKTAQIALDLRPKVLLVENVTGALQGRFKPVWNGVENELRLAGYRTQSIVVNASHCGLSQDRKRVFLIAWLTGAIPRFNFLKKEPVTLFETLDNCDGLSSHSPSTLRPSARDLAIARRISPGQSLSNVRGGRNAVHTWEIPEVFGATTQRERDLLELILKLRRRNRKRNFGDADPLAVEEINAELRHDSTATLLSLRAKGYLRCDENELWDLTRTFNGKYRRLSFDKLSPTVHTKFGDIRYFIHPTNDRGLTPREAARIQGFPDNFAFDAPQKEQFRMIGNAVPPSVGKKMAELISRRIL
ncbi:DNA-cytosine methyltransferase [Salinisphaera shabanensis T35B1]|uniref:DNA cytosine methyltransferase n=1 Tax=Salinisphaera shabanensis TaxID=180542 RepID=UPI00334188B9